MSRPARAATSVRRTAGPTRMGVRSPSRAASTALSSETASQGWATAVAMAGCLRARSTRRSYLACGRAAGEGLSGIGRPQRRSLALEAEQRFDSAQAPQTLLGQGAACAEHLQQGVERGSAGVLAVGQELGDGAHGAFFIEAEEEILVFQTGLQ